MENSFKEFAKRKELEDKEDKKEISEFNNFREKEREIKKEKEPDYVEYFKNKIKEDLYNKKITDKEAAILYNKVNYMAKELEDEYEKLDSFNVQKEYELYEEITENTLENEKFKRNFSKVALGLVGGSALLHHLKTVEVGENKEAVLLEEDVENNTLLLFTGKEFIKTKDFEYNPNNDRYTWNKDFKASSIEELNFLDSNYQRGLVNSVVAYELGVMNEESLNRAYNVYLNSDSLNFVSERYKGLVSLLENEKEEEKEINDAIIDFFKKEYGEIKTIYDIDKEKEMTGGYVVLNSRDSDYSKEVYLNPKTKVMVGYEEDKYIGKNAYEVAGDLIKDLKMLSFDKLHSKTNTEIKKSIETIRDKVVKKKPSFDMDI